MCVCCVCKRLCRYGCVGMYVYVCVGRVSSPSTSIFPPPLQVKRRMDAGEPYTVRFKVSPGKRVEIDDMVRGNVAWDADATVGDFILLRSSGVPVYNFCVAGALSGDFGSCGGGERGRECGG